MTGAPHILIAGGGIGGLCLAQGLKKSGISVAVYERRLGVLQSSGLPDLAEGGGRPGPARLPAGDLFELCVATAIRQATRMAFTDEQLNPAFTKPLPLLGPGVGGLGVNRLTLREILLAGLDGIVHFGKTVVHFGQCADGGVRADFADGTSATGDLLVGADGTGSVIRSLLVPGAIVDDLDWAIYGRTEIGADTLRWMPEILVDSFNRITGPGGVAMAVPTCRTREPVGVAAARLAPALRLTPVADYPSWTVSGADERYRNADGPTLRSAAADLVRQWHPAVRRIIAEADGSATFPVAITSARPVEPWQAPNVTLLGDAIHTMSPGRGDGATIALRDAQLLRGALVDVAAQRVPLAQAKARYEAEMLRYGFARCRLAEPAVRAPAQLGASADRAGGPGKRSSVAKGYLLVAAGLDSPQTCDSLATVSCQTDSRRRAEGGKAE